MKYYYSLYFSNKVLGRLLIDNEYRRYFNAVTKHDVPAFKRLHSQTLLVYTVEAVPLKYTANS